MSLEFLSTTAGGRKIAAAKGYRPHYAIYDRYQTTTNHEFLGRQWVSPGETVIAHVWFITPEIYPYSLWPGRVLEVSEGSRVVGHATVRGIVNPVMNRELAPHPMEVMYHWLQVPVMMGDRVKVRRWYWNVPGIVVQAPTASAGAVIYTGRRATHRADVVPAPGY